MIQIQNIREWVKHVIKIKSNSAIKIKVYEDYSNIY